MRHGHAAELDRDHILSPNQGVNCALVMFSAVATSSRVICEAARHVLHSVGPATAAPLRETTGLLGQRPAGRDGGARLAEARVPGGDQLAIRS